jgi:hypothetical protein
MTIRQRKLLLLLGLILSAIALGLNIGVAIFEGWRALHAGSVISSLAIMLLFGVMWRRLSLQEAEHGADYALAGASDVGRKRKLVLLLAAAGAFLAAGFAVYFTTKP